MEVANPGGDFSPCFSIDFQVLSIIALLSASEFEFAAKIVVSISAFSPLLSHSTVRFDDKTSKGSVTTVFIIAATAERTNRVDG